MCSGALFTPRCCPWRSGDGQDHLTDQAAAVSRRFHPLVQARAGLRLGDGARRDQGVVGHRQRRRERRLRQVHLRGVGLEGIGGEGAGQDVGQGAVSSATDDLERDRRGRSRSDADAGQGDGASRTEGFERPGFLQRRVRAVPADLHRTGVDVLAGRLVEDERLCDCHSGSLHSDGMGMNAKRSQVSLPTASRSHYMVDYYGVVGC